MLWKLNNCSKSFPWNTRLSNQSNKIFIQMNEREFYISNLTFRRLWFRVQRTRTRTRKFWDRGPETVIFEVMARERETDDHRDTCPVISDLVLFFISLEWFIFGILFSGIQFTKKKIVSNGHTVKIVASTGEQMFAQIGNEFVPGLYSHVQTCTYM